MRSNAPVPSVEIVALWITGAVSVLLPVVVWSETGGALRVAVVAISALVVPGAPVALAFYPTRRRLWLAVAPMVSFSVLILLSMLQLLTNMWYPMQAATVQGLLGLFAVLPAARRVLASSTRADARNAMEVTESADGPRPGTVHRRAWSSTVVIPVVSCVLSFILWGTAASRINLAAAGSRGLVTVLPVEYFIGLLFLVGPALWLLVRKWDSGHPSHWQLGLLAASLMVQITTFVGAADGGAVVGTGYVHVGFVDAIGDLGRPLEGFDARFSWPGFFAAFAALQAWAGTGSVVGLLPVYPAMVSILFIPTLLTLGRSLTGSDRIAWGGVFVFSLVNWVQQDYFSPQSLAFLLYFAIIAILFAETGVKPRPTDDLVGVRRLWHWLRATPSRPVARTRRGELGVEVLVLLLATTMALSHQLTPVALLTTLVLLGITGVVRQRSLWIGVGVIFVSWFAYGAQDWWSGNLSTIIDGFGKSQEALNAGISGRVQGSAVYQQMQQLRIVYTALLGVVAVAGWYVIRTAWARVTALLLIVSPVSLILMQTYGGEVILRVVLYLSPVLAVLAAAAVARVFSPRQDRAVGKKAGHVPRFRVPDRVKIGTLVVGAIAAAVVGVTTRGTNTAFERNPASTIDAARTVLDNAPAGSVVVPIETDAVLRMDRVGELRTTRLSGRGEVSDQIMAARPDYVFFSSARQAYEHILHGMPADWFAQVLQEMVDSGDYEVFTRTATATVLRRIA